jgi:excisionase family DNA binding protein
LTSIERNASIEMCQQGADATDRQEIQMEATKTETMLNAAEVAQKLKVHVTTVYRLASSGRLRAHHLGQGTIRRRGLRIPESAVAELLRETVVA